MKIFTIGFTKKSARTFFTTLRESGALRVVDVRLNNVSQLAGFAKKDDLQFFLREISHMDYVHLPILVPTAEILDTYKKKSLCLAGDGNRSKELGLYNFLGYDITHAWPTSARDRRATNATS